MIFIFFVSFSAAEEKTGIVAKVTTENKGPLKLRTEESQRSRVLTEIPNGTCILVVEEGETWCRVIYQEQIGYCKTEFLVLLRDADPSLLEYRVLKNGDKGEDVLALMEHIQEEVFRQSGIRLEPEVKIIRG